MSSLIHISSFLRKEIVEVLRQPRLILALVFGPFLILLLFGLGYRNEARAVRTLFVVDEKSELARQIEESAPSISPQLIYMGMTQDEGGAQQRLKNGQVDMLVVVPNNAYQTIRRNKQAAFTIFHNEIDPAQVSYIEYLGQIYVDEVNRRVLSSVAQQGQQDAGSVRGEVQAARQSASAMRQSLEAGNVEEARGHQTQMRSHISTLALAVGSSAGLLSGVEQNMGPADQPGEAQDILNLLNDVQSNPASSQEIPEDRSYDEEIQQLREEEADLERLENRLAEFERISPQVLTRPFTVTSKALSPFEFTPMHFFTPGVIALLLQHITVTIAGLSIVRERRAGTIELFRVSPITAGEALIGKYLSYMFFGVLIATILGLLLAFGLRVPMLGNWWNFALVVFVLLFSSLGIGFFISLIASTESQAVQFAMIALLLSVFFSGFILDLRYMWGPVKAVSWILPATYGTVLLQNIMLRGGGILPLMLLGMAAIGIMLFLISWLLMRRQMAHE